VRAADPQSVRRAGRTRAARAAVARREHLAPSPVVTKCECAYKSRPFLPSRVPPPAPSRHCRRRRSTPSSGRSRCNPSPLVHSLGSITHPRLARCPAQPPPHRHPESPRQPPPAAVDPPRRQPLRPHSDHPSTLGEHLVGPHRLPRRERGRLTGILPVPPPPTAEGLNCLALIL
jgi:hypothetical protein